MIIWLKLKRDREMSGIIWYTMCDIGGPGLFRVLYINQLTLKMWRKDDIKFILFHSLWRELPFGVIHDCTQPFRRDNLSLLHPAHPFISVCLSISPSIHRLYYLSIYLFFAITPSTYHFISLFLYLPVHIAIYWSIYEKIYITYISFLYLRKSVRRYIYMAANLFITHPF